MAWKIYFWIIAILTIIGTIAFLTLISKASLGDWISTINNLIIIFGLYVFVFNKKKFTTGGWKKLFLINLVLFALISIDYWLFSENLIGQILPSFKSNLGFNQSDVIFGTIITLPALYANFKLTTRK